MKRHLFFLTVVALLCSPALADPEGPVRRTFRLDLSARATMTTQDYSGKATISDGKIVRVQKRAKITLVPTLRVPTHEFAASRHGGRTRSVQARGSHAKHGNQWTTSWNSSPRC